MQCRLTRIESAHCHLRTDVIDGWCDQPPRVGIPFHMHALPLEDPNAHVRLVHTTEVLAIEDHPEGGVTFRTRNSTYRWEETE